MKRGLRRRSKDDDRLLVLAGDADDFRNDCRLAASSTARNDARKIEECTLDRRLLRRRETLVDADGEMAVSGRSKACRKAFGRRTFAEEVLRQVKRRGEETGMRRPLVLVIAGAFCFKLLFKIGFRLRAGTLERFFARAEIDFRHRLDEGVILRHQDI